MRNYWKLNNIYVAGITHSLHKSCKSYKESQVYKKSFGILISITLFSNVVYADGNAQYENMAKQLSLQLQASLKVMNDPKILKLSAAHTRNLYNAYIAEGFSKDQAMQLVIASIASKK